MARNNYFQFKQFTIHQENAGMKVGTDGVLLGAWTSTEKVHSILDVGTGTGLIALMLAQRSDAMIKAIEIEDNSIQDANLNFQNSPWKNRIEVIHTSFQNYLKNNNYLFDCVVCNPPYFTNSMKSKNVSRTIARHNDHLPFEVIVEGASQILNPDGHLSVILPVSTEIKFRMAAAVFRLFPSRITRVKPKPTANISRVLIELSRDAELTSEDELTIETEKHHEYLPDFKKLISEFYLHE